jgi:putative N6-adenine-specific DNA methylase
MSQVFPYKSDIVITCFPKQSEWLAKEVRDLGYAVTHQSISEVEINGYFD